MPVFTSAKGDEVSISMRKMSCSCSPCAAQDTPVPPVSARWSTPLAAAACKSWPRITHQLAGLAMADRDQLITAVVIQHQFGKT